MLELCTLYECRMRRAARRRWRCTGCWTGSRALGCAAGCRPASSGSGPSWRLQACLVKVLMTMLRELEF